MPSRSEVSRPHTCRASSPRSCSSRMRSRPATISARAADTASRSELPAELVSLSGLTARLSRSRCNTRRGGRRSRGVTQLLERLVAGLGRAYANRLPQVGNEDLAVADLACLGRTDDDIDHRPQLVVAHDDLEFHLGHEV